MSGSTVKKCVCAHKAQDARYGEGMRVWNALAAKKKGQYRCTVCKREQAGEN